MGTNNILSAVIQSGSFIAAFAAIAAGIVMSSVTKKFGAGILASGFKTISFGVIFIAIGITLDAINSYFQMQNNVAITAILIIKELLFVIGTYTIVIGSKQTGDKLESLTK